MRPRRVMFVLVLLATTAGGVLQHRLAERQSSQLAAHAATFAQLEARARSERADLARVHAEAEAIEREIAAARAAAADAEARSSMKLWANRIALLRRLLEEMPTEALPELRLLTPTDWVHVVRARELDTPERIRNAMTALRATARRKMFEKLQEALQRFTDALSGELPRDIRELAAHLSAPADLEMLLRYSLVRSGRIGASDEVLITENATSDMIGKIGLKHWHINNNQEWKPSGEENETAAMARLVAGLEAAIDHVDPDGKLLGERLNLNILPEMISRMAPIMEAAFGDSVGDELKAAAKRFMSERNGVAPANMAELAPYLPKAPELIAVVRPILAQLEYVRDHPGQPPPGPAQLRRYLEKPLEQIEILQAMKLTMDGDSLSMNISVDSK